MNIYIAEMLHSQEKIGMNIYTTLYTATSTFTLFVYTLFVNL